MGAHTAAPASRRDQSITIKQLDIRAHPLFLREKWFFGTTVWIGEIGIYYNSAILSHLLTKCEASGNTKAVTLITKTSPATWRHILLNGHYTFQSSGNTIDGDALLAGLELG